MKKLSLVLCVFISSASFASEVCSVTRWVFDDNFNAKFSCTRESDITADLKSVESSIDLIKKMTDVGYEFKSKSSKGRFKEQKGQNDLDEWIFVKP